MKGRLLRLPVFLCYLLILAGALTAAMLGSRTVTIFTESRPQPPAVRFVLDAGHGQPDGGAVSCTGKWESQINLNITKRLNDLLHLLGMDTVMTRSDENSIFTEGETIAQKKVSDIRNRVSIVNNTENAVLISIHQNHFSDPRYYGPQVFYNPAGKDLAQEMQKELSKISPGSARTEKRSAGVFLLEHISCTGVLIECGFLSNLREEALLRDPQYQKKLCCVIASVCSRQAPSLDRSQGN